MDIATYILLTGKTIPSTKIAYYEAIIKRVQVKLETILGWSFTPQVLYKEIGKTQNGCVCSNIPETLLPADEVKGIIKIFPFNRNDKYLQTDPFYDVYSAKLVRVFENRDFVTLKTFENISKQYMSQGIGKYLEKCKTCFCDCECKDCVLLAVDGDWVRESEESGEQGLPIDLLYLWCDMVDFYGDPEKDIKSESVDGHSWSKGDVVAPEESAEAKLLLARYAGPYGTVPKIPTL